MSAKPLRKNDIKVLSEIEHCLKRPSTWIGSTKEEPMGCYIYENGKIVLKEMRVIPGLLKIFDEVVSNSVDEAIKTRFKYATKIQVETRGDEIFVRDSGRGLPIEKDKDTKRWVPEVIVTQLRAGSNFDDSIASEVVGQNGVGVSLTNIYSDKFTVNTTNGVERYQQTFRNNLKNIGEPKILVGRGHFTEITFTPSYDYFKISDEAKKHLGILIEKRIRDLAFAYPEIKFTFNGKKVSGSHLKKHLRTIHDIFECVETEKIRLGVFYSDTEFQQLSFVNGADTRRGGTHVDLAVNTIIDYLRTNIKRKYKFDVKPIDIRSKLFLMLALRMSGPKFDSQTKERLINDQNEMKEIINGTLSEKFLKSIFKNEEIIEPIIESYKLKEQVRENIKLKRQQGKIRKKKIAKHYDAISRNRDKCTLFIVEGDSAGATFLSVRDEFCGALKLRGKIMNVHSMKPTAVTKNEELTNIMVSTGLEIGKRPKDLHYGRIAIMTDADVDGNHISGLLINFFNKFWPELFEQEKIIKILSPLYIAKKGKEIERFYTFDEWNKWKKNKDLSKWKISFYKGLGGLSEDEYERMITDPNFQTITKDKYSKKALITAFGPDADLRKKWMSV